MPAPRMPAPRMNILGLDTSLDVCSVALRSDGHLAAEHIDRQAKGHAERLLPMLQQVVADARLTLGDLDVLGVAIGPGLFTGVRVGIATVRGLRMVLGVPAIGVSTLHAIALGALRAGAVGGGSRILVANDARNGEAYVQSFAAGAVPEHAPELLSYRDAITRPAPGTIVLGSAAALFAARSDVPLVAGWEHAQARVVAEIAEAQASAPGFCDPGAPSPLYVRAPHARTMDDGR